ncbi:hypothetical protein JOD64_002216 [Micromonospora luteifusca]|uniref:EVE domain-containing protein n=1 Tax=Micromonospora luteifusca TaxID=709860 RepID=A0ABS2LS30_9ACTN|nr:hypothetical protein [Micromonospora luteifusca]
MAFSATPRGEVAALAVGDGLYLYSSRSAWKNPARDRGRVIGHATVASAVSSFDRPLEIGTQRYLSGCTLRIDGLVPYPNGLEVAPLVRELEAFPKPDAWAIYLRRTLLTLPPSDVRLLDQKLRPLLRPRVQVLPTYPSRFTR